MNRLWQNNEFKIACLCFIFFAILSFFSFLDGLEVKTIDLRFNLKGSPESNDQIVVVAITDQCLSEIGRWPWSRSIHAHVINFLRDAGAKLIVFDVLFSDPSEDDFEGDSRFIQACFQAKNVIFPMHFAEIMKFDPETSQVEKTVELSRPFPMLASVALDMGIINVDFQMLNPDGIVRRINLINSFNGETYFPLSLITAKAALKEPILQNESEIQIGKTKIPTFDFFKIINDENSLRLEKKPCFLINYLGTAVCGAFSIVYFSDILAGTVNPKSFKDKIVLIGPTAVGLGDIKLTPFGEMPGVIIHANIIQNIIQKNFLYHPGHWISLLLLSTIAIALYLLLLLPKPSIGNLWASILFIGFNLTALFLFKYARLAIDMVVPSLLMLSEFLIIRFYQMFIKLRAAFQSLKERTVELEKTNAMLDNRIQELTIINEAGAKFPSILDLEILSKEILNYFMAHWKAQKAMLLQFDPENDCFCPIYNIGYENQDGTVILCDPQVAAITRRLIEERNINFDPNGKWFTSFLPLILGSRLWGAIFLKEENFNPKRQEQEKFWLTMLGLAATALENANLYHLATVDSLTRLYVRRFFTMQLEKELKRVKRYGNAVSLLITDIDHFKKFNDTYGHQQGDVVLREVAATVKESLRDVDIAARYGGEEFALILPQTNLEGALIVAERIRIQVEKLFVPKLNCPGDYLKVTISVGIASYPETNVESSAEFIKLADEALYSAKQSGRNRVKFALPTNKALNS